MILPLWNVFCLEWNWFCREWNWFYREWKWFLPWWNSFCRSEIDFAVAKLISAVSKKILPWQLWATHPASIRTARKGSVLLMVGTLKDFFYPLWLTKTNFPYMRQMRKFFSPETTKTLVQDHAFVSSNSDHCNSLLYGVPNYQYERLQKVLSVGLSKFLPYLLYLLRHALSSSDLSCSV